MKKLAYLLISCVAFATVCGCKKNTEPSGSREYQVEYRITSPTAAKADIDYTNETGGSTSLDDQALPKSYTFRRTMSPTDFLTILVFLNDGKLASEVTVAILLDGNEVEKQTGRGVNASVAMAYQIPFP